MGKVIVVTSGKGGVGKTTTTVNLGAALAEMGKNVLLVDTDFGLRNLDLMLGMENRVVFDVSDVLSSKCRLRQALVRSKRTDRLTLLPAPQTKDKTAVTEEQMRKLVAELKESYDFVFLDCPAGIDQGFANAVCSADEAIIVCTPEIASVRDADRVSGLLASAEIEKAMLLVNRVRGDLVRRGEMMSVADVEEILGLKAIGAVPDDEQTVRAANIGEPVVYAAKSPAGTEYKKTAMRLCGMREEETDGRGGLSAFLRRIIGSKIAG